MNRHPAILAAIAAAAIVSAATLVSGHAQAAPWTVDYAKSKLGFTGTASGASFDGSFQHYVATIDFDPAAPAAGHAVVDIDMASAVTGDPQRDQALPQDEWFDVSAFPKAKFEATKFVAKGGNAYEADGTLSIRDVSKPVTLPFTLDLAGNTAHAKGTLHILRTDFGVGQGDWSSGQYVALDVAINVDIVATKP